ncbi:MAG TPA: family 1 glycosylhydrolase [Pseudomonadota bacterium]|nr:family 1 glycosylhydrolase [Pseudomonadota bacterium]
MKRLPLFSVLCFALSVACESPPEKSEFPKDFRFGTAIAGFQTEMGCPSVPKAECEYASDWAEYVTRPELRAKPGLYLSGDPLSAGPGFFELYPQDIALAAQQLHNNSLRLSIEWGRVFPTATDGINDMDALKQAASKPALAFYHRVFSELKKQGIKPLVTLIHYALPTWLHDAYGCHVDLAGCKNRGWLDRARIVRESAKYAAFLGREFGGEVDDWATLNEPFTAVILAGYVFPTEQRTQPPAVVLEAEAARAVLLSEIEAHARMYDALKGADRMDAAGDQTPVRVGVVYNLQAVAPVDPENPLDVEGAKHFDYLLNRVFLNATIEGDLDEKLDGEKVHRQDLAHRMDFVGVNYYARNVIPGSAKALLPSLSPLTTFNFLTLETDFHYPRGLYEVLVSLKEKGLPLIVTETGVEDAQDSGKSAAWVSDSLSWVLRAISEGVRVEGYHYWTLMDNYEWNHGMRIKMGLYAVSPNDPQKKRIARKGVSVYSQIAQTRMLPQ